MKNKKQKFYQCYWSENHSAMVKAKDEIEATEKAWNCHFFGEEGVELDSNGIEVEEIKGEDLKKLGLK